MLYLIIIIFFIDFSFEFEFDANRIDKSTELIDRAI